MSGRARIHELCQHPLDRDAIERASFAVIDREAGPSAYSGEDVRRLIHASADLSLNDLVRFSPDAIDSALR